VAPDHRLLHEKYGLLSGRTIAIEGGQHWRKTVEAEPSRTGLCGASPHVRQDVGYIRRHWATEGYFALSNRIAVHYVEHGVLRCRGLTAFFETKSCLVVACGRDEEDVRRSRREDDGEETICGTLVTTTVKRVSCVEEIGG